MHLLFCLLYNTKDYFSHDFPKISEHFQKISEGQTNVGEHFRIFPKITKDFRGRSDDVLINDTATHLSTV